MIKKILNLSILTVFTFILFKSNAKAEFSCRTEIHYKWKKVSNEIAKPIATPKAGEEPKEIASDPEFTVFWASIEKKGTTEEESQQKVNKSALNERASAERSCLANHENMAGCIAGKFSSLAPSVSTLSFSAKKAVEDAISVDCQKQQGKCSGSTVGEIKCIEKKVEVAAKEEPAKEPKKKK